MASYLHTLGSSRQRGQLGPRLIHVPAPRGGRADGVALDYVVRWRVLTFRGSNLASRSRGSLRGTSVEHSEKIV